MTSASFPMGRTYNPSAWSRRTPVLLFSLLGYTISSYLAFYQVGIFSQVWEPFFGNGSTYILKESAIARFCPVPDAALGAFAYLLDVWLECLGSEDRWRTSPWIVLAFGSVTGLLALSGLGLALSQPLVFHHYCTLCLASAACSLLAATFAAEEIRAAVDTIRQQRASGASWFSALRGER